MISPQEAEMNDIINLEHKIEDLKIQLQLAEKAGVAYSKVINRLEKENIKLRSMLKSTRLEFTPEGEYESDSHSYGYTQFKDLQENL